MTNQPDNTLQQLLADAVRPWLLGADEADVQHCATAVMDAILPTTRLLDALHKSAHDDVTRVIDLYERWVKAGPPPLGTSTARWWDMRLAELHNAIHPADQPAAAEPDTRYAQAIADVQSSGPAARHDDGPSIAEAAADDRTWDLRKAGE